jgi:hypothetical protein
MHVTRNALMREKDFEDHRRDALMATVDQIRYTTPNICREGHLAFTPESGLTVPIVDPRHPFYREHFEPFNLESYEYPRPPIDLGHSRVTMDGHSVNVLRMPIKYPGTEFRIPKVIAPIWDLIRRVAEYEAAFNGKWTQTFVHVTVDRAHVQANTTHRYPGFHGDGVQGAKFSQKAYTPAEHSYIVTSEPPTEFCIQPFYFRHLNDGRNNIFQEMEVQARDANIYGTLPWHLYLIDPYMVHRTPPIVADVERIFVRVTIAYSELMNPHNTENPLFPATSYAKRYDIRKFLTLYPAEIPWEMYGLAFGPKTASRG